MSSFTSLARFLALISLLALMALAAPTGARGIELSPHAVLRIAEFEAALAAGHGIYLVLDPADRRLQIKSRGLELDALELTEILLLDFRPLFAVGDPPTFETPAVWKIAQGPGDADRETIAPPELRPYTDEGEAPTQPVAAAAAAANTAPSPARKPDEELIPTSYRVGLDNGWQLYVTAQIPRAGFFRRLSAAARDGWLRLKGKEPSHPRLVALVMPPELAQRLHHLFRTGTEILILP